MTLLPPHLMCNSVFYSNIIVRMHETIQVIQFRELFDAVSNHLETFVKRANCISAELYFRLNGTSLTLCKSECEIEG